jgi:anti-anti-sigma factor
MKITTKINGAAYLMDIEGAIVGTKAVDLEQLIRSINLTCLDIDNLVLNLSRVSMIDSIGLEAIKYAQEQGLKVSILGPRGLVKDMLERAMINGRLSPFLEIVQKEHKTSCQRRGSPQATAPKEIPISIELPVSC